MLNVIKKLGMPVLREVAPELENITDKEVTLASKMKFLLPKLDGYGLAACQIGVNKRLFVYDIGDGAQVIVNPVLGEFDNEMWLYQEGCLSIPGFYFPIWRPRKVLLRGWDLNGKDVRIEASDLLARLFQHELDHLSGKLVIDLLTDDERVAFSKKWKAKRR